MAKTTNLDLLKRAKESHAAASEIFRELLECPPNDGLVLYSRITELRNRTRSCYNATQEVKNRVKQLLNQKIP